VLGIYTIALSVFGIFNTFLASGTPLTISKLVSINHSNHKKNHSIATAGFIINLIIAITLSLLVLFFQDFFNLFFTDNLSYIILLTMIPAILSTGIYTSLRGYLYGKEKYLHIGLVELIEQIFRIVFCFALIYSLFPSDSPIPAGIAFGIAGVLSTIIGVVVYFKCGGRLANPKGNFKTIIKTSAPITLVRLGGSLIVPLISIILPLRFVSAGFSNEFALAQIGIILGMTMPLLSIPSTFVGSFSTALIPRVALAYKEKDFKNLNQEVNSSLNFSLILTYIVIPAFIALGEPICKFLFNSVHAGTYLTLASFIMVPMTITQISTSVLNSIGKEAKSFWIYLFSSIFLIASVYFLPSIIGTNSIIIGMGLSSTISAVFNMRLIQKASGLNNSYLKTLLYLSLLCIPVIFLTKFIYNICISFLPLFFALAIAGVISIVGYSLLLSVFNIIDIKIFYQTFKNRLSVKALKLKNKPIKNK